MLVLRMYCQLANAWTVFVLCRRISVERFACTAAPSVCDIVVFGCCSQFDVPAQLPDLTSDNWLDEATKSCKSRCITPRREKLYNGGIAIPKGIAYWPTVAKRHKQSHLVTTIVSQALRVFELWDEAADTADRQKTSCGEATARDAAPRRCRTFQPRIVRASMWSTER